MEQHLANFDLAKDDKVLLLGLWIDGVPFNSDRSQTLETITLCLFGEKGLRVPLCAFPKAMRAKGKTYECIFEALAWSFRILLVDKMPHQRHTQQEFNKSDAYTNTKKLAGWSMYKEALDFPSWSAKGHICWLWLMLAVVSFSISTHTDVLCDETV